MADAIKSLDSRTIWEISDAGELTEIGPSCQKYTIDSINTEILLELMVRNADVIHTEAHKLRGKTGFSERDFFSTHSVEMTSDEDRY